MSELSNFIVFVSGSASKRGSLAGGSETGQAGLPAAFPPPGPGRPGDIQGNTDKLYEEQYAQYYRYCRLQTRPWMGFDYLILHTNPGFIPTQENINDNKIIINLGWTGPTFAHI